MKIVVGREQRSKRGISKPFIMESDLELYQKFLNHISAKMYAGKSMNFH